MKKVELFGGPCDGKVVDVTLDCETVRIPIAMVGGFGAVIYRLMPNGRFEYDG